MTKQIDGTKDRLLSNIFTSVHNVTLESKVWGAKFLEKVQNELFESVPNDELERIAMLMKMTSADLCRKIRRGELRRDGKIINE